MPEAKSYNRKFACGCIASNGYRMTIWSTREVHAICTVCEQPYRELKKGGELIEVKQSHVEKPGENAIRKEKLKQYENFEHFKSRDERDIFLDDLQRKDLVSLEYEEGIYQKQHNGYIEGFPWWLAYTAVEKDPDPKTSSEEPKKKAKDQAAQIAPAVDPSTVPQKERSHENPADLIELYRELGALKAIAEYFGVAPGTITYQKKKHGIDFGKGTYVSDGETISI